MDALLYHSDMLLQQLNAYEVTLMLEEQTNNYISRYTAHSASSQDEKNSFSSLKLYVIKGMRYMYDQCRFLMWHEVQETKATLLQLADKTGYSDLVLPSVQGSLPQEPLPIEDDSINYNFPDDDSMIHRQD